MANRLRELTGYTPWLVLMLAVDGLAVLMLWLANVEALRAMACAVVLATMVPFALVCGALLWRAGRRRRAFAALLNTPDEANEEALVKLLPPAEAEDARLLAQALRSREEELADRENRAAGYEEYVELWAHEIKTPVSLLALVLDNHAGEFSEDVALKLETVRTRTQSLVEQMLYYARTEGERKDWRFERIDLAEAVEDVVADFRPLLAERGFTVDVQVDPAPVMADARGLSFILSQVVANAVKYAGDAPELVFSTEAGEDGTVLRIQDNGCGCKACDLPFVFEKGFTGSGPQKVKATGMGLYLAREVARELGLGIWVESTWQEGFAVLISFPQVK